MIPKEMFLRQLFAAFENWQIDYFVIGEYQSLPEDTGGSDIDIVVSHNDVELLMQTLREKVANNEITLASQYCNQGTRMFRLITPNWGVQIDIIVGGLYYRGMNYYPWDNLKKHVIKYNNIKVLERQYGFSVEFFKEIIHNGRAKSKYCEALLQSITDDEMMVRGEILSCFSTSTWNVIKRNQSIVLLNCAGAQIRRSMLRCLSGRVNHSILYYLKLTKRLLQPVPGYVIVVEGTDGSGKSAIINSVTPWLAECFHNSVVYNHLRPNLLPDIGVIFGKRKANEKVHVVANPHVSTPSGTLGSILRWLYYMHDYTWGYLLNVFPKIRTRSYVYLFDRYYYDYYIDQHRSLINLPKWVIRLGELFVPKPDIILCLGGEPEKIYARKPETSLEEVARQTEELKRFAACRKNALWIDTTQPIENSIRDAKSAILNMMSKRFKNVL